MKRETLRLNITQRRTQIEDELVEMQSITIRRRKVQNARPLTIAFET